MMHLYSFLGLQFFISEIDDYDSKENNFNW